MKVALIGIALASCQPKAQPSIFLSHEIDGIKIKESVKARPMGIWMGDLSTTDINNFRKQFAPSLRPICYLDPVGRASFVGTDRSAQRHIEEDLKAIPHDPFRQLMATSDGRNFVARIGLAEECFTGAVGAILVIQDAGSGEIVNADMDATPFMYLWPANDGGAVTVSNCVACDTYALLVYDAKRGNFTWETE